MPGTGLPSGPGGQHEAEGEAVLPIGETPARFGIHRTWVFRLSGFARSASMAAAFPCTSLPGTGIATSSANIAERPDTRSVLALASENARSAARSSSATDCGVRSWAACRTPHRRTVSSASEAGLVMVTGYLPATRPEYQA